MPESASLTIRLEDAGAPPAPSGLGAPPTITNAGNGMPDTGPVSIPGDIWAAFANQIKPPTVTPSVPALPVMGSPANAAAPVQMPANVGTPSAAGAPTGTVDSCCDMLLPIQQEARDYLKMIQEQLLSTHREISAANAKQQQLISNVQKGGGSPDLMAVGKIGAAGAAAIALIRQFDQGRHAQSVYRQEMIGASNQAIIDRNYSQQQITERQVKAEQQDATATTLGGTLIAAGGLTAATGFGVVPGAIMAIAGGVMIAFSKLISGYNKDKASEDQKHLETQSAFYQRMTSLAQFSPALSNQMALMDQAKMNAAMIQANDPGYNMAFERFNKLKIESSNLNDANKYLQDREEIEQSMLRMQDENLRLQKQINEKLGNVSKDVAQVARDIAAGKSKGDPYLLQYIDGLDFPTDNLPDHQQVLKKQRDQAVVQPILRRR